MRNQTNAMRKYIDRHNLVVELPRKRKAPKQMVFMDRRGAISWPTVDNPGYVCVFGLEDVPSVHEFNPVVLLDESSEADLMKLCQKVIKLSKEWSCQNWYADLKTKEEILCASELSRTMQRQNYRQIKVSDTSEWAGFEEAMHRINTMKALDLIKMPRSAKCYKQMGMISADDLKKGVERKYHAAAAFIRIVTSYILAPWRKPVKREINLGMEDGYR